MAGDLSGKFYIDVFFVTEWLMNSMVLWIYCCLTGTRITAARNLGISLSVSVCSVTWFWLLCGQHSWNGGWAVILSVFCASLELMMIFPKKKRKLWKKVLLELPSLFLSSFLLAGSLLAVFPGKKRGISSVLKKSGSGKSVVFKMVSAVAVTGMICGFLILRNWRRTSGDCRNQKQVWISLEGQTYTVTAITDTGNHLYEKGSGYPVHIVEEQCLFTEAERDQLMREKPERFQWIPYTSLGNQSGILPVLRVDQICIGEREGMIRLKDQRIGLTTQSLSPEGEWQMLLHPDLEKGRIC